MDEKVRDVYVLASVLGALRGLGVSPRDIVSEETALEIAAIFYSTYEKYPTDEDAIEILTSIFREYADCVIDREMAESAMKEAVE